MRFEKDNMFASFNSHRDVDNQSIAEVLSEEDIMQNELNQRFANSSQIEVIQDVTNFMQNESNDVENFDAFEILMFNFDVDLEQAERRFRQLKKFNKIRKIKKRIRFLKQDVKISSNVKSFSNTLMRLTSISERLVESLMQSQFEEFIASRKRSI